jgi:hypothetical protein
MTAVIDRLEQAGYVERVADPADRRRTQVRIRPEAIRPIEAVYAPIQARMIQLWSSYSPRDLEVIRDFLSRSTDLAVVSVLLSIPRAVDRRKGRVGHVPNTRPARGPGRRGAIVAPVRRSIQWAS